MCCGGGSAPQAPQVQYVGPSSDEIRRNEQSLAVFQQQIAKQQQDTAAQIQSQIDAANARTAQIQQEFDDELAASQSATEDAESQASAAQQAAQEAADRALAARQEAAAAAGASFTPVGAYGVTASVTEAPEQTTEKIKAKKKPKGSLKISPTAAATAGSGLNLGI